MTTWYKTAENPPKKHGMYLVLFRFDPMPDEECGLAIDCAEWFNEGDKYTPDPIPRDDKPELERIVDILSGEYDVAVTEAGFYEQSSEAMFLIKPEFWAYPPLTPEGRACNAPEA